MLEFTKHEASLLKYLNSYKNKDLSINNRILKAKLSLKLQKIHAKHSKIRLKQAKAMAPLLLGRKLMNNFKIKSFDDLLNRYFIIPKASAMGRKLQMSGNQNSNSQSFQK